MIADVLGLLTQVLVFLDILFAVVIIFFERRNPAVTWAWLMVILFLPYIGFIIYLCLGLEGNKHRTFADKAKKDRETLIKYSNMDFNKDRLLSIEKEYTDKTNLIGVSGTEHFNDLIYLNFAGGFGFITGNNTVDVFHGGNSAFSKMIEDIRGAKKFIHIQYYIVRNDGLGKSIISELSKRAAEGVEVKFLVDGMGCMTTPLKLYKPLIDAGGKLGIFLPPYFVRINYRNHRKICVIDGMLGFVGGLNIGDEYLGKSKRFGHWRDAHVRISGDSIKDLELRFMMDWNYCVPKAKLDMLNSYFPIMENTAGSKIQIISSGPDTKWASIRDGYVKMITEADRSIYIQTPYFVPDDTIFETLKIAALSGIDVKIMIPANPDHPFVYWAALSYLGELINAGVECYQYKNGFVHSKLIMVDSLITSVGTANIDIRSFKLNFEINSFIYDKEITSAFERKFFEDIKDCQQIDYDYYRDRSNMTKIKESISRLISPLL